MLIECPYCDFSREVPDDKIPPTRENATCPKCKKKFKFRGSATNDLKQGSSNKQQNTAELSVPFENLKKYGVVEGFFLTLFRITFTPRKFFGNMPQTGVVRPLLFCILSSLLPFILIPLGFYIQFCIFNLVISFAKVDFTPLFFILDLIPSLSSLTITSLTLFIVIPASLTIVVVVSSMVNHLFLILTGAARNSYEATFRATTYATSPFFLWFFNPFVFLLGLLWSTFLIIIALKETHNTSYYRIFAAMGALLIVSTITKYLLSS